MKNIKIIYGLVLLLFVAAGCTKKDGINNDISAINTVVSESIAKIFDISTDNSGNVKVTPTGVGVTSSTINFGHGSGSAATATVAPGGNATHSYPEGNYNVTIISTDIAGKQISNTYPLTVTYKVPENLVPSFGTNANSLSVKATALYASSFLVYWGDVVNEVGTPMATGATLYHIYAAPGVYNVKVVAISGNAQYAGVAKTEVTTPRTIDPFSFALPITFENAAVNYFFGTFGGGQQFAKVANPDATGLNTTATVGKFTRGFDSWSGTYSPLNFLIDLSVTKKIKILAYNPDPALIGKKINIELESAYTGAPGNGAAVLKVPFTTSGAWEELVFDFSTLPAVPATAKFGQLVLRFNDVFNGNGTGGTGSVFYLDNFRLTN